MLLKDRIEFNVRAYLEEYFAILLEQEGLTNKQEKVLDECVEELSQTLFEEFEERSSLSQSNLPEGTGSNLGQTEGGL